MCSRDDKATLDQDALAVAVLLGAKREGGLGNCLLDLRRYVWACGRLLGLAIHGLTFALLAAAMPRMTASQIMTGA
jgi:hypothetical protein